MTKGASRPFHFSHLLQHPLHLLSCHSHGANVVTSQLCERTIIIVFQQLNKFFLDCFPAFHRIIDFTLAKNKKPKNISESTISVYNSYFKTLKPSSEDSSAYKYSLSGDTAICNTSKSNEIVCNKSPFQS